ncbi:Na+/H+ antiporter NhaC [Ichthyobacterium seriolicida]|uniref:Na+/H+ antiporter NhaC n=1 Tax=Ichthyobacterium seriolicida TaxID=242600 RepID=A0A1J1DW08_9FLAO|nr:Na+/H+ antiporter NhaC [Ichthyobacterium seriolicida]BAV94047.1 Na+/H+ antiporter NhaC [Ichthyobacterium seriolicida]
MNNHKRCNLLEAFIPLIVLIGSLFYNIVAYDGDISGGASQLSLLMATAVGVAIGFRHEISLDKIISDIEKSISSVSSTIIILFIIGSLSATWMISGIVPTMIYYGLKIINTQLFLVTSVIMCSLVSVFVGSSWTTVSTIGLAMLGIGKVLNFPEEITAGAIVSGAYFGDKMSPFSETTNLASAVTKTDLFSHIRYMMYTSVPSIAITIVLFLIIGYCYGDYVPANTQDFIEALDSAFNISPMLLIIPLIILIFLVKKEHAIKALFIGMILGVIAMIVFQSDVIEKISGKNILTFADYYTIIINVITSETVINTNNEVLNELLSTSGMKGMLNTVWLIIMAMSFGGMMESIGALDAITNAILRRIKNTPSLFAATTGTCLFLNTTVSDQYLSILISGKMYNNSFRERGLAPQNLSRTIEDSATVTSPLIPWNTCGVTQSSVLGVSAMDYLPYAFFNYMSPILTLIFGFLGIKIKRIKNKISSTKG